MPQHFQPDPNLQTATSSRQPSDNNVPSNSYLLLNFDDKSFILQAEITVIATILNRTSKRLRECPLVFESTVNGT